MQNLRILEATPQHHRNLLAFLMQEYPTLGWSQTFMDWQYYQNPGGIARSWVAVDGENVVANYTAIPHRMYLRGTFATGWRAQDVITHPGYRGHGLYAQVSDAAVAALHRPEFPLNFTFPNENSHGGFIKRNWHNPNRIPLWTRAGAPEAQPCQLQLHPLQTFSAAEEALWHSARTFIDFAIDRSAAYLNWRYFANPRGGYFPFRMEHNGKQGVLVLKRFSRETGGHSAHLMDAFAEPGFTGWEQVIPAWMNFAHSHGADFMSLWHYPSAPLAAFLPDAGFVLNTQLTRWHVLNTNTPEITLQQAADHSRWHFSMGDTDVY